ncbi:MAG: aspartate carbamoyltransferase [Candidatus Paceibacterota bacterium]
MKYIAIMTIGLIIGISGFYFWNQKQLEKRQTEIHAKGSEVMPFDLTTTTHVFQKTKEGGLQQVRAEDSSDKYQITQIQDHLQEEAERFATGDFGDPAQLHGDNMPGLATLKKSSDKISVEYQDLDDGGQIIYMTDDEEVVQAIQHWFDAQLTDHGSDAVDHSQMMH